MNAEAQGRLWKRQELGPAFSLTDGKAGQVLPPKLCHGGPRQARSVAAWLREPGLTLAYLHVRSCSYHLLLPQLLDGNISADLGGCVRCVRAQQLVCPPPVSSHSLRVMVLK